MFMRWSGVRTPVSWAFTPYSIPPFLAAALAVPAAIETWRHRDEPAAHAFLAVVLVLFGWSMAYGIQLGFADLSTKLVWQRISLMFGGTIPVVWLVFAIRYAGLDALLTRWTMALLAVDPLVFTVALWTNPSHHLLWSDASVGSNPGLALDFELGYYVHITYAYLLVTLGVVALAWLAADATTVHRKQSALLVLAATVPFGANVAFTLGASPIPGLDLTTFTFALSASLIVVAMFRLNLLDIAPVARRHWVAQLGDGVVVLDTDDRVVELNHVAAAALTPELDVGDHVGPSLPMDDPRDVDGHVLEATFDGERRFYDLRYTTLTDHHGRPAGSLVGLRDVTERTRYERRLEVANRILRHNFRNAMNVIQGNAEMLSRDLEEPHATRAKAIERRANEVIDLTEGIQEIATTLDFDEPTVVVDLTESVTAATDRIRVEFPGVTVAVDATHPVLVEGVAKNLVDSAVDHVVENAAEYNDDPAPAVRVTVVESADTVSIRVADNGPGIPEAERAVVEDGEETPLVHGSGIGLWLVSWVLSASGGSLTFEENQPRGSVVTLSFPAAESL